MSNEVSVRVSLQIRKGFLDEKPSASYRADMAGSKGPTPGAFTVTTDGTDVDLSELITPGFCFLKNLDATNFVEYGIWEPATSKFYPLGVLRPGRAFVLEFSPNLFEEYEGTGTGTSAPTNTFRMKANGAPCNVAVEAYEA